MRLSIRVEMQMKGKTGVASYVISKLCVRIMLKTFFTV